MTSKSNKLFDSSVKLFKSLGGSASCENGVLCLNNEINLSKEQAAFLNYLYKNKELFRKFDLMIDWDDAESNHIVTGALCTKFRVEFDLYEGSRFSFYRNEQDLFQKLSVFLIQGKALPENYYFIDDNFRSDSELVRPSLIKLKFIMEWLEFLTKISDIDKKIDNGLALYYFIKGENDKFAKPLEIKIDSIYELVNIDEISSVEDISTLISEDENGNLHHRDRQSFFKLALVDTLNKLISQDTYCKSDAVILFSNLNKIKKAYYDHYDVFIHNFAIGEFQQQVEEKGFDYAEKISSVLNDIQIRLYAIPIVLVSLGALAKVDNIYSYLFIISGVIITALFNYWMISDQVLRLEQIEKSSTFTFEKLKVQGYEKLESGDILKNLDAIVSNIQQRITDRNTKITYYKFLCWLPALITFFLLLVKEKTAILDLFSFDLSTPSLTFDSFYCVASTLIHIMFSFING
jgi:hypothetical protein